MPPIKKTNQKHWITQLALPALGVVFGDIGTSPLYTLRECLNAAAGETGIDVIMGVLSLIFWAVTFVVSVKYVYFIMKADNQGEGGIMALLALALHSEGISKTRRRLIVVAGLIGAALFYGDGMITPAISVLSAIEGLELITPAVAPYILPITLGVLIALFLIQKHGTAGVGKLFGPVMLIWFLALGGIGLSKIIETPQVLNAVNPRFALQFLLDHGTQSLVILGAVVLSVTGAEALYADMGHFGAKPIRAAWFYLVFPALIMNYFGQGANVIQHPEAIKNPFFLMFPDQSLPFVVGLATLATVIASQAVISGAFSLTQQAFQLGYLPRVQIMHTSETERGQIFLPSVNKLLLIGIVVLVLSFESSSNLASAYGIAVTGTMLMTTFLYTVVARVNWKWPVAGIAILALGFGIVDLSFLCANLLKFVDGGWLPVLIGAVLYLLMSTWIQGRTLIYKRLYPQKKGLEDFVEETLASDLSQVSGTAVYLAAPGEGVPNGLRQNVRHNKVLHQTLIVLTIQVTDRPRESAQDRLSIQTLGDPFFRVIARFGFMEHPDIPEILRLLRKRRLLPHISNDISYFVSRLQPVASDYPGMALWREKMFVFMLRNAAAAPDFFRIPYEEVIELHMRIEI
ncbi:MAG TPA: potassium transporter Kup [Methylococcaceae bacterium]|nr:potassium transporter Kup [Methylococcaceae bacterium]